MEYKSHVNERSTVSLVPYSPVYRAEYRRMYNECYHEMRQALDIQPYDFIQDDRFFDKGTENIYLLTDSGSLIGSVTLKGDEIDDLLVERSHQGQGYGRQILLWALEHIGAEHICLHAAEWNQRAIGLYRKTGFEIVETITVGD